MNVKKRTDYVLPGEAAKMLGISRSTVQRYFDKGTLSGGKNAFTNRRFVSMKSVLALMKKYNIEWKE